MLHNYNAHWLLPFISFFMYFSSPTLLLIVTWWKLVLVDVSSVVSLTTLPIATPSRCPSTATWQLAAPPLCRTLRSLVSFIMCDMCVKKPAENVELSIDGLLIYIYMPFPCPADTQIHKHTATILHWILILMFWCLIVSVYACVTTFVRSSVLAGKTSCSFVASCCDRCAVTEQGGISASIEVIYKRREKTRASF